MRLHEHGIASMVVSGGVYALTGSVPAAAASFISGILIDTDHVIDYWIQHPFKLDLAHFFRTCEELRLIKVRLVLHSLELILLLGFLVVMTRSSVLLGVSIGFAQHLAFDQWYNSVDPRTYFLLYRMGVGFKNERIFRVVKT
jgi:hypothetical protein